MKKIYFKSKKITSVSIIDKSLNSNYEYRDKYKERFLVFFGKTHYNCFLDIEYYYDDITIVTPENILKNENLMIENNIVYYKPKVILTFSDREVTTFTKYFNTFNQAYDWAKKIIEKAGISDKLIEIN